MPRIAADRLARALAPAGDGESPTCDAPARPIKRPKRSIRRGRVRRTFDAAMTWVAPSAVVFAVLLALRERGLSAGDTPIVGAYLSDSWLAGIAIGSVLIGTWILRP